MKAEVTTLQQPMAVHGKSLYMVSQKKQFIQMIK